jgi:protein-S-isoprenylcysteine O-methyltransferase Ste14
MPVPIILMLLLAPADSATPVFTWLGVILVVAGELLRLWAVRHIGVISRTRTDRLGPLIAAGPFARVRNPLYLGNIALWVGFALSARVLWLVPVVLIVLGVAYHAIVRWEETLLETRRGEEYRDYRRRIPRWLPSLSAAPGEDGTLLTLFSWRDTLFSERGTLIAIVVGYALLYLKSGLTA